MIVAIYNKTYVTYVKWYKPIISDVIISYKNVVIKNNILFIV